MQSKSPAPMLGGFGFPQEGEFQMPYGKGGKGMSPHHGAHSPMHQSILPGGPIPGAPIGPGGIGRPGHGGRGFAPHGGFTPHGVGPDGFAPHAAPHGFPGAFPPHRPPHGPPGFQGPATPPHAYPSMSYPSASPVSPGSYGKDVYGKGDMHRNWEDYHWERKQPLYNDSNRIIQSEAKDAYQRELEYERKRKSLLLSPSGGPVSPKVGGSPRGGLSTTNSTVNGKADATRNDNQDPDANSNQDPSFGPPDPSVISPCPGKLQPNKNMMPGERMNEDEPGQQQIDPVTGQITPRPTPKRKLGPSKAMVSSVNIGGSSPNLGAVVAEDESPTPDKSPYKKRAQEYGGKFGDGKDGKYGMYGNGKDGKLGSKDIMYGNKDAFGKDWYGKRGGKGWKDSGKDKFYGGKKDSDARESAYGEHNNKDAFVVPGSGTDALGLAATLGFGKPGESDVDVGFGNPIGKPISGKPGESDVDVGFGDPSDPDRSHFPRAEDVFDQARRDKEERARLKAENNRSKDSLVDAYGNPTVPVYPRELIDLPPNADQKNPNGFNNTCHQQHLASIETQLSEVQRNKEIWSQAAGNNKEIGTPYNASDETHNQRDLHPNQNLDPKTMNNVGNLHPNSIKNSTNGDNTPRRSPAPNQGNPNGNDRGGNDRGGNNQDSGLNPDLHLPITSMKRGRGPEGPGGETPASVPHVVRIQSIEFFPYWWNEQRIKSELTKKGLDLVEKKILVSSRMITFPKQIQAEVEKTIAELEKQALDEAINDGGKIEQDIFGNPCTTVVSTSLGWNNTPTTTNAGAQSGAQSNLHSNMLNRGFPDMSAHTNNINNTFTNNMNNKTSGLTLNPNRVEVGTPHHINPISGVLGIPPPIKPTNACGPPDTLYDLGLNIFFVCCKHQKPLALSSLPAAYMKHFSHPIPKTRFLGNNATEIENRVEQYFSKLLVIKQEFSDVFIEVNYDHFKSTDDLTIKKLRSLIIGDNNHGLSDAGGGVSNTGHQAGSTGGSNSYGAADLGPNGKRRKTIYPDYDPEIILNSAFSLHKVIRTWCGRNQEDSIPVILIEHEYEKLFRICPTYYLFPATKNVLSFCLRFTSLFEVCTDGLEPCVRAIGDGNADPNTFILPQEPPNLEVPKTCRRFEVQSGEKFAGMCLNLLAEEKPFASTVDEKYPEYDFVEDLVQSLGGASKQPPLFKTIKESSRQATTAGGPMHHLGVPGGRPPPGAMPPGAPAPVPPPSTQDDYYYGGGGGGKWGGSWGGKWGAGKW